MPSFDRHHSNSRAPSRVSSPRTQNPRPKPTITLNVSPHCSPLSTVHHGHQAAIKPSPCPLTNPTPVARKENRRKAEMGGRTGGRRRQSQGRHPDQLCQRSGSSCTAPTRHGLASPLHRYPSRHELECWMPVVAHVHSAKKHMSISWARRA